MKSDRKHALKVACGFQLAVIASTACTGESRDPSGPTVSEPVASVAVAPIADTIAVGGTLQLTATVRDAQGNELIGRQVTWASSNTSIATVSSVGLVRGIDAGTAEISARSEGKSGNALITVRIPVSSITVTPATDTIAVGASLQMTADLRDAQGRELSGRDVTWSTSHPSVASVSGTGLVSGLAPGSATITARSEGKSGTALIIVREPVASVVIEPAWMTIVESESFQLSVIVRDAHGNVLNDRSVQWSSSDENVVAVSQTGLATGVLRGYATVSATAEGNSDTARIRVAVGFTALSAGLGHTCGIVASGAAYCWGYGQAGRLGTGSEATQLAPAPVAGGLSFRSISSGFYHTCGTTTDNRAYCWGSNSHGELGDGTTAWSSVPQPVYGGISFASVSAGASHTCALTPDGSAYCWGYGVYGRLGNRSTASSTVPVAVAGGSQRFSSITVGANHSCALEFLEKVACWGGNGYGQLGIGSRTWIAEPIRLGSYTFNSVDVGTNYTCTTTSSGTAFCWGWNNEGQLGNGSTTDRLSPTLVTGGHAFTGISAGFVRHTCATTTAGWAYCWGRNSHGQLGFWSTGPVAVPAAVSSVVGSPLDRMGFQHVTVGGQHTCGLQHTDGFATHGAAAYCWGLNNNGQLGNGTTLDTPIPELVADPVQ